MIAHRPVELPGVPFFSVRFYVYRWRNNPKRATLFGRICRVLARGALNSALIEFIDNGQREVVSRNALRRKDGSTI